MKTIQAIITESEVKVGVALNSVDTLVGTTHDDLQKLIIKIVKTAILETASSNYNMDLLCAYAKEKLQQDFDDSVNNTAALEIIKLTEKIGFKDLAEKMY
jgi:hypothetical protein